MKLLLQFLCDFFDAFLFHMQLNGTIPKWLRITVRVYLLLIFALFLVFAILRYGWAVVLIIFCLAAFSLLILVAVLLCRLYLFGILMHVRKKELPHILKLYRSVVGKPGYNWSVSYPDEATLHEDLRTGNLYVLWKGSKIIGAASIVPKNKLDNLQHWFYHENAREIAWIIIDSECQGKGYGKYLVRTLCNRLHKNGCRTVHLLVSTQNPRAIKVYQENGFRSRGPVHRYDHDYYAYERKLR